MTITFTDLFCGAGGSSLGGTSAGMELVMAANHWSVAIDVHQAHFPDAAHDCADVTQVEPRRYPRTDVLLASPECTNHSAARGISRRRQQPSLWEDPDPGAERSRATMWDVVRFAEQMRYDAIVVENVVDAAKWVGWRAWHVAMEDLGYEHRVLSHNSMHHGVPQSRDRIYVVFWRRGLRPDLELELSAHCPRCDQTRTVRQGWKNGRRVGKYRQQWVWCCTICGTVCEPATRPAADIIDWSIPCPRIGDRSRPLAESTRRRVLAGLIRYGWAPVITAGAGNGYERTPGNRSRPLTEPLGTQTCTATHALATPPGFLVQTAHGARLHGLDAPHPTVCASDDRLSLVVPLRNHGQARPTGAGPVPTITAAGNHLALVMRNNTPRGNPAQMVTPTWEPVRTITTKGHQSLLVPDEGHPAPSPHDLMDLMAFADPDAVVNDCRLRMVEPPEAAAGMGLPPGYIPAELTKKAQMRLAGNAVTPPVMTWIGGRIARALTEAAA